MTRIRITNIAKTQKLSATEKRNLKAGGLASSPLGFAPRSLQLGAEENGWLKQPLNFGGEEAAW